MRICNGATAGKCSMQRVRKVFNDLPVFRTFHSTACTDNHFSFSQRNFTTCFVNGSDFYF
jgi:hypothetical protein